jgi:hypothetical protein
LSQKVETLARQIAGPDAGAVSLEFARQIAEAQMDLRRVREARHQFLSSTMSDQYYDSHANVRAKENLMGRIFGPRGPEMSSESFAAFLTSIPQVQHKLALIVAQEAKKLLAMDRYERRAWSNRNSAIRAFDAARQQSWQRTP